MKIVPFEDIGKLDMGLNVWVDDVTIRYFQDPDCTESSSDDVQEITISSRNNGIARFIHFQTESWSIGDPSELQKLLEDFMHRAGIEAEKEKENANSES